MKNYELQMDDVTMTSEGGEDNRLQISSTKRLYGLRRKLSIKSISTNTCTLATVAIEQVQQLLKHNSTDATLKYVMLNQNNEKSLYRRFNG